MSYEQAFEMVQDFVKQKPACRNALRHLSSGAEIQVIVDDRAKWALFYANGEPQLEDRAAKKPDVEFRLNPEAVRILTAHPAEDMASFGIEVTRQILSGNASVRVCGNVIGVLTKGYVSIIKEAGPEFSKFLAQHGLKSLSKIGQLIRSLKK